MWERMSLPIEMEKEALRTLLGREAVPIYSLAAKELVKNKIILVTGAGGSIGSEIVRQLMLLDAKKVYCLDNDEFSLYRLSLELYGNALLMEDNLILVDIRDKALVSRVFSQVRPDIVYHAAAHKHLPLLERSPVAAIKTNVLGTENIASACVEFEVEYFVNISTDKAAAPISTLGISKRLAELYTAGYKGGKTRVASVRFGNVLGSRGSFLPTLMWQIEHSMPITVTHPEVSRFFMTIPEAAALVIEASALAVGGETYVLDMGEQVRILDLIERYIKIAGCHYPEIVYTGLRPGEKLHEDLFDPCEIHMPTAHPRISKANVDQSGMITDRDKESICGLVMTDLAPQEFKIRLQQLIFEIEGRKNTIGEQNNAVAIKLRLGMPELI